MSAVESDRQPHLQRWESEWDWLAQRAWWPDRNCTVRESPGLHGGGVCVLHSSWELEYGPLVRRGPWMKSATQGHSRGLIESKYQFMSPTELLWASSKSQTSTHELKDGDM